MLGNGPAAMPAPHWLTFTMSKSFATGPSAALIVLPRALLGIAHQTVSSWFITNINDDNTSKTPTPDARVKLNTANFFATSPGRTGIFFLRWPHVGVRLRHHAWRIRLPSTATRPRHRLPDRLASMLSKVVLDPRVPPRRTRGTACPRAR